MSELTQCNRCSLEEYRRKVALGERIVIRKGLPSHGLPGGIDVFRLRPGEAPGESTRIAWFMELTDGCRC